MARKAEVIITHVSETVKKRIVEEIESGRMSQLEAARECGVNRTSIRNWLKAYGKLRLPTRIVEVIMKDEKEKIEQLQQALAEAHLKLRLYDKMISFADAEYKTDIKKNFGTKASELLKKKDPKSRKSQ